jgi:hypothetical protein
VNLVDVVNLDENDLCWGGPWTARRCGEVELEGALRPIGFVEEEWD